MFVQHLRDRVEIEVFVVISGINCQSVELEFQMNDIMEIKVPKGENFTFLFFIDAGGIRMLKLHDDRLREVSSYVRIAKFAKDNPENIDKRSRTQSSSKSKHVCHVIRETAKYIRRIDSSRIKEDSHTTYL